MNDGEEESHLIHKPSTRNGTPELLPRGWSPNEHLCVGLLANGTLSLSPSCRLRGRFPLWSVECEEHMRSRLRAMDELEEVGLYCTGGTASAPIMLPSRRIGPPPLHCPAISDTLFMVEVYVYVWPETYQLRFFFMQVFSRGSEWAPHTRSILSRSGSILFYLYLRTLIHFVQRCSPFYPLDTSDIQIWWWWCHWIFSHLKHLPLSFG
jgi:hypothetical protein